MTPRRPTRLLEDSKKSSAYPKELLANYSSGELTLIDDSGNEVATNPLSTEVTGSGNAVKEITVNGRKITIIKAEYLTEHPTISMGTDTTNSVKPGYGGTFTAIDSVTKDSNGHISKVNLKTVTMPSAQTDVSGNAGTANKLKNARTISLSGGATGSTTFDGSNDVSIDVTVDASQLTGIVPLSSIPKGAQERLIPVTNEAAMLLLTADDIQIGDVVKLEDSGLMYYVVDESKLGTMAAFSVFTAGAASSVPWTGVTGKPSFANVATSGNYNDLSNKPTIPSAGTSTPSAASTNGSAGNASTYSKSDHSHPAQTTVSGNAGSATKLATARTISLSGSVTGSASFDGSKDITITTNTNHTHNYAGSSSAGGSATKVYETLTNPSTATEYYIPFHSNISTGDKSLLGNNGLKYYTKEGTTSEIGFGDLGIGNKIPSGTAGNKRGMIYLYGTSSGNTTIVPGNNTTSDISITLPSTGGTLSLDGHTHNYAGSGSAGGSANSAVKLDSSAGSATQPVYFSDGKPTACTYTLGKSVPSNAVFTDTNTKVTSAANHYAPSADSSAALSVDASSTTSATWASTSLVTGVNLQRDAKGHVTGVTVDSIRMPANPNTDTKNTAGSTDTSSKIYLVGATSQAANPQTYSDNEVYVTSGVLTTKKVQVGGTAATLEYDSTNKCINFVFA